jgi:GAF domain-containing protein/HAMP domain-containing protein
MKALLRMLNILHWPLWLKLSAGFLVAVAIPVGLILLLVQSGLSQIGAQTLVDHLRERGALQRQSIIADLDQSQVALSSLLTSPDYRRQMLRLFSPGGFTPLNARTVALTLQSALIGSGKFERFRLLSVDGQVMAQATSTAVLEAGLFDYGSPTFLQAVVNALSQNLDKTLTVAAGDPLVIEMAYALRDDSSQTLGFLIGTLDVQRVLLSHLNLSEDTYPLYSYLVTTGKDQITLNLPEAGEQVSASQRNSPALQRALQGAAGLDTYRVGTGAGQSVVGYYSTIPNPANPDLNLFALVTEVSATTAVLQANSYFGGARLFPMVVGLLALLGALVLLFHQIIAPPLQTLRRAIRGMAAGDFNAPLSGLGRGDEIGALNAAFVDMRVQVRTLLDDLNARVADRSRDISATQEISRYAVSERNLQILMNQVVQLIIEKFPNIYHAQIFLLDVDRRYAVLRASTGAPGRLLLARGHRLEVGSVSVIGQVVEQRQTVVARDTTTSAVHKRNEFLPETRAELAIPLRVGEQVIGALDVQSKQSDSFSDDEITVLQIMADQVAVALENARLYQESVRRLEEVDRANRQATTHTWQEYIYGQRQRHLNSESGVATGEDLSELRRRAIAQGKPVIGEATQQGITPIAVPIQLRGQTLGAVEWELPTADLDDNKLALAQELANRLAVSLDNARLFQESQRAAERERVVSAIAAKLTPQTEINDILQTAVREVGQVLRAPQVTIRLHGGTTNGKQD